MTRRLLLSAAALALLAIIPAVAGAALRPGQFSEAQRRLERFIADAAARSADYFGLFKDLTAEETKTVEVYRSGGDVSKRRTIVSEFVVYQSQLDNASVAEYRNVVAVDGTPVQDRQERVANVLARSAKAGSTREELKRITKDGSRFDLDHTVSGLTIAQGLPLQPWARSFFDFAVEREERRDGRRLVVLRYQQTAPNARFGFKLSLPQGLEGSSPLYRGRLWLDADTAHLWREEREVTVADRATQRPVIVQRAELSYAASPHGVPLPSRIDFVSLTRFQDAPDGGLESTPVFRITFEYGPFRRFTADSGDVALAPTDGEAPMDASDEPPAAAPAVAEAAPGPSVEDVAPEPDPTLGPEFAPEFTAEQAAAEARARELERLAESRLGRGTVAPSPTPMPRSAPPAPATAAPVHRPVAPPASQTAPEPDPSLGPEFDPSFSAEDALANSRKNRAARRVVPPATGPTFAPVPEPSEPRVSPGRPFTATAPSTLPVAPKPPAPDVAVPSSPASREPARRVHPVRRAVAPPATAPATVGVPAGGAIGIHRPAFAHPLSNPGAPLPTASVPPRIVAPPPATVSAHLSTPVAATEPTVAPAAPHPPLASPAARSGVPLPTASAPPKIVVPPPAAESAPRPTPVATPTRRASGPTPAPAPSVPAVATRPGPSAGAPPPRRPAAVRPPRTPVAPLVLPASASSAMPGLITPAPVFTLDGSVLPLPPKPVEPDRVRPAWRPPPS